MKKAILATKVGMTQIFNEEDGVLIPVTVLQAGPCVVTQVKTVENDGYSAVQVGYVDKKEKIVTKDNSGKKSIAHRNGVTKAEKGHFDKAGVSGKRYVKEFRFENAEEYTLAQEIKADIFAAGDKIDATAISKGKGFQGAIKRHGQSRGPMTHGSKFHRHAGSNGALGENPSPYVLTFVVFLLCCVLTNFMSNTATTALMVPICLSIAQGMGADPRAVLMACVIGGSCAYATPIGMPANTMVVGAGNYKFMDYVKSGFPLIIIATVVSMIILPIAFPFFP